jgi:hypothetical protein
MQITLSLRKVPCMQRQDIHTLMTIASWKKKHLEDHDVDGRIALTRLLRNRVVRVVVNGTGSGPSTTMRAVERLGSTSSVFVCSTRMSGISRSTLHI